MGNIWFTGPTPSDVPAATKRSHAAAAPSARARSAATSCWPKEMVAGFHGPPQSQRGTAVPASQAACATARGARRWQAMHSTAESVPWMLVAPVGLARALAGEELG